MPNFVFYLKFSLQSNQKMFLNIKVIFSPEIVIPSLFCRKITVKLYKLDFFEPLVLTKL